MDMSNQETNMLMKIVNKIENLKIYLDKEKLNNDSNELSYWYSYFTKIKRILGNFDNDISYIACLMAEQFLCSKYSFNNFDVSIKPQSAPGLDIDEITCDNKRVIAEIKTTIPYSETDLGAQQKKMFLKDFEKLKCNEAEYKYFFVTELKTFEIVKCKYSNELVGVTVILLPKALSEENNSFIYSLDNNQNSEDSISTKHKQQIQKTSIINSNKSLNLSDTIRDYIYEKILKPSKEAGTQKVIVKSSDIHTALKLINRYPAVCSAMKGAKIEKRYNVQVINTEGNYGRNFTVTYKL